MPASIDDPPLDGPKPPPPQSEIRDENLGTIFKIGGSGCIAACTCGMGAIMLILPMMFAPFGWTSFMGFTVLIGLICTAIGCYAGFYGWRAAEKGSEW